MGYYDQVHAHSYYPPYLIRNSEELVLPGNRGGREGQTYSQYVIFDEAKKFISANANKDRPFFCYLPITPPHGMFDIPDADPAWAMFKDKAWSEDAKRYAAMVALVDRQVGELFQLLEKLKLDDNTIVFFCGDNGGNDYFRDAAHPRGFHGANVHPKTGVEFRGKKGNLYEGGLRIPMIVRWPGRVQPGRVSDLLWYFPDVFPTLAEIAGAKTPDDLDGMSILPELVGAGAAGREQPRHDFLYWELGAQTAVRKEHWKAIRSNPKRDWELYDLSKDVSEENDVADRHKEVLASMVAFAKSAHTPAEEGVFHDREIHEKDRRAKWGDRQPPPRTKRSRVNKMSQSGLLPRGELKLVRASSESGNRKASHALDGDPRTHWHTRFQPELAKHPHDFVIDLGGERTVRGFRYLPRQDGGWNGALAECEFHVSANPNEFDKPIAKATFKKSKQAQDVRCDPIKCRYVRLRILSEVNGGPWASIAELGVIGD